MGYSARYHAASLAAVFLALAIGILVGAEFGGEVLSDTRKSLERSLVNNLEDSRREVDQLSGELDTSREFGQRVYPAMVGDRLLGDRVGLVAMSGLSSQLTQDIEEALEPSGAELAGIGVLRTPPQPESLARALPSGRFADAAEDPEKLKDLGALVGHQLVSGGNALKRLRGDVFSRISGNFGDLDRVIVVRAEPGDLEPADQEATEMLEDGLMRGLASSGATVVGVETSDTDPSSIPYFEGHNVASVDNIDTVSGRLAMVLALLGAKGNFGIKETADSLLPDLIAGTGVVQPPSGSTKRGN